MPELTPLSKYLSFILSRIIGWNRFSHLALLDSPGYSCLSSFSYKFQSQSLNIHTHTQTLLGFLFELLWIYRLIWELTPLSLPVYEHGISLGIRIIVIACFVFYINGFFYICLTLGLWGSLILQFVTMFFCCVLLHCVHIPQSMYPFCCWWAFVWLPHSLKPQYEQCYYQYTCSHVLMNVCIHFLWYI